METVHQEQLEPADLSGTRWRISLDLASGRTSLPDAFRSAICAADAARRAVAELGYSVAGASYCRGVIVLRLEPRAASA